MSEHPDDISEVLDVPSWRLDRLVKRLTSCIEHDHDHVFVVDQSASRPAVRLGVTRRGLECLSDLLEGPPAGEGTSQDRPPTGRPVGSYSGPDRDFGQHDDYRVGDEVWTYDNAPGMVVFVDNEAVSTVPKYRSERVYNVEGPDHTGGNYRVRTYDASRLALVRRKV